MLLIWKRWRCGWGWGWAWPGGMGSAWLGGCAAGTALALAAARPARSAALRPKLPVAWGTGTPPAWLCGAGCLPGGLAVALKGGSVLPQVTSPQLPAPDRAALPGRVTITTPASTAVPALTSLFHAPSEWPLWRLV